MFSFQAYIIVFSLLICYSLSLYNIKFRFNRLIKPNDIYNRKIHSHDNQQTYDAAVIGSGIGGHNTSSFIYEYIIFINLDFANMIYNRTNNSNQVISKRFKNSIIRKARVPWWKMWFQLYSFE